MNSTRARERVSIGRLAYIAATTSVALFFIVGWSVATLGAANPLDVVMGDWIQFHRVGQRLAAGDWQRLYPDSFPPGHHPDFPDGLYFLYPPFALPATLLFAGMSPIQAYLTCVAIVGAAGVAMVGLLVRALRTTWENGLFIGLGLVASGCYLGGLALGHLSVLIGLVAVLGFYLHQGAGRPLAAGAVWGLLLVKPNWGVPLAMLLLVGCRWREALGFAAATASLILVGLFLDHGLWADWIRMIGQYGEVARAATPPHRQLTLFASIQSLVGLSGSTGLVQAVWAVLSATLALGGAWVWFKGRAAAPFARLFATAIVVILAVNPYAYFYDGVPLVAAAAVWWTRRDLYGQRAWSVIGFAIAAVLVWEHLVIWTEDGSGLPSLAGLAIGAWAAAEILDLARSHGRRAGDPEA